MNSQSAHTETKPLLFTRTKLRPPRLRSDTLPRPRLLETIRRSIANARLALVSAPAGYGKTTLVANAVTGLPDTRVAWLTVDSEDDEPLRFFSAFSAALQPIAPEFAELTTGILAAGGMSGQRDPLSSGRALMTALVNELFENEQPFCLILDDLHYVAHETIHSALNFLIERLPPHVTLIVTTRHDPPLALAQLRARRELVELRLEELRFTSDEMAALLNQHFGLSLAPAELEALMRRTEGWAAGMTLISASLQRIQTANARSAFFEQIAHNNRYLFDYLAETVLAREEPATRDFLIATSILDVLTPVLCAAITRVENASQMLDQLYHRNLFLIGLDGLGSIEQASYRYHDLFRTFLSERVQRTDKEIVRIWHRRAAEVHDRPSLKIHHLLQAEEWEQAASVIEHKGRQLLNENAWQPLLAWIDKLPADLVESRPRLQHLLGSLASGRWELSNAIVHLERAIALWEIQEESSQQRQNLGETLAVLTVVHSLLGNAPIAAQLTERTLTYPITVTSRVLLLTGRIWMGTMMNNAAQVCVDLDEAMDLLETHPDRQGLIYLSSVLRAAVLTLPGSLIRAERFIELSSKFFNTAPVITQAAILFVRAAIAMWRDAWTAVQQHCDAVMELSQRVGGFVTIGVETESLSLQAMRLAVVGDWEHAKPAFKHFLDLMIVHETLERDWLLGALNLYARACWINDQLDEAKAVYKRMESVAATNPLPFKAILVDEVKALIWLKEGHINEAKTLMQTVVANRPSTPILRVFGESKLTLAYVCVQAGDPEAAMQVLAPLLAEIEEANIPGLLRFQGSAITIPLLRLAVEKGIHSAFASKLLARLVNDPSPPSTSSPPLGAPTSFRIPDTGEILTEREIEVLRLIARGDDNPTIATEMIVSVNTVKTHVAHILAKLGVASRTAAAMRAKELGLVK